MSDFKIVCGVNQLGKAIINLDKVKQIYLFELKDIREVIVEDITNRRWKFETDLTTLEQVFLCLSKSNEAIFSIDSLNKNIKELEEDGFELRDNALKEIGIEKVEDRYIPIKED